MGTMEKTSGSLSLGRAAAAAAAAALLLGSCPKLMEREVSILACSSSDSASAPLERAVSSRKPEPSPRPLSPREVVPLRTLPFALALALRLRDASWSMMPSSSSSVYGTSTEESTGGESPLVLGRKATEGPAPPCACARAHSWSTAASISASVSRGASSCSSSAAAASSSAASSAVTAAGSAGRCCGVTPSHACGGSIVTT
mmetsp:Transcript_24116/g.78569  ORF Transcript_24116/g.78569 Transcript_24116/m.78569 type:complete len:201 (+) Transcript_24116:67-669(+)